jgi:hypothetical protein
MIFGVQIMDALVGKMNHFKKIGSQCKELDAHSKY